MNNINIFRIFNHT